eukprot:90572-Rhodomonas_salina.7
MPGTEMLSAYARGVRCPGTEVLSAYALSCPVLRCYRHTHVLHHALVLSAIVVSAYARAMRCPVLRYHLPTRARRSLCHVPHVFAKRCPVLKQHGKITCCQARKVANVLGAMESLQHLDLGIILRTPYAVSGTVIHSSHAMSGTALLGHAGVLRQ